MALFAQALRQRLCRGRPGRRGVDVGYHTGSFRAWCKVEQGRRRMAPAAKPACSTRF